MEGHDCNLIYIQELLKREKLSFRSKISLLLNPNV